jgi:Lrp/AsnC family transcriptional regulator, regulator for asnA, asnC and gidA
VRPGTAREVCRRLSELPETSYVIMTAGQYDVMAEVICHDTGHLTDLDPAAASHLKRVAHYQEVYAGKPAWQGF